MCKPSKEYGESHEIKCVLWPASQNKWEKRTGSTWQLLASELLLAAADLVTVDHQRNTRKTLKSALNVSLTNHILTHSPHKFLFLTLWKTNKTLWWRSIGGGVRHLHSCQCGDLCLVYAHRSHPCTRRCVVCQNWHRASLRPINTQEVKKRCECYRSKKHSLKAEQRILNYEVTFFISFMNLELSHVSNCSHNDQCGEYICSTIKVGSRSGGCHSEILAPQKNFLAQPLPRCYVKGSCAYELLQQCVMHYKRLWTVWENVGNILLLLALSSYM